MKRMLILGVALALTAGAAESRSSAGSSAMKVCAAQWDAKKAAGQTGGQKYRDFSKACLASQKSGTATAVAAAPATPAMAATAPTPAAAPAHVRAKHAAVAANDNTPAATAGAPTGASAKCKDGTFSLSKHHSGTCSHHRGVASWL